MSGFMSSSTALKVFILDAGPFSPENIRKNAFSETPPLDCKLGWVGLGNALDTDFSFGIDQGRYMAFSLRVDARKVSSALVKIRLAEEVQKVVQESGKRIGKKRRKELKEAVIAALTAKAEYIPEVVDCIIDLQKGRLFVGSVSQNSLKLVLEHFARSFGKTPKQLVPGKGKDMAEIFSRLLNENMALASCSASMNGCNISLASPKGVADKAKAVVLNTPGAVESALEDGLFIARMGIRLEGEINAELVLSSNLSATVKLPKARKGDDPDGTFMLKADALSFVATAIEELSR